MAACRADASRISNRSAGDAACEGGIVGDDGEDADKRRTGELIAVGGRKEKPRGSPGLKRSPIGASRIDQFLHLTFGRSANEARAPLLYARCPVD